MRLTALLKVALAGAALVVLAGCGGGGSSKKCYMPTKVNYYLKNQSAGMEENKTYDLTYDGNGYLVKQVSNSVIKRTNNRVDNSYSCIEYSYNDKYLLEKKVTYDGSKCKGNPNGKFTYEYNSDSLLSKKMQYSQLNNNSLVNDTNITYSYYDNKKLKEIKVDGNLRKKFTYNGNTVIEEDVSINREEKFVYDNKNRVIEYYDGGTLKEKYSYNDKGYVDKITYAEANKTFPVEYKYDKNGNIVNAKEENEDLGFSIKLKLEWQEFDACNYNYKKSLKEYFFIQEPNK
jgi:hypothetical protein